MPRSARRSPPSTGPSRRWTAHEKIRCGAYVYFSFLRPYAEEAGLTGVDWTVPRDIPGPLYELVSAMEGDNAGVDEDGPYYAPLV